MVARFMRSIGFLFVTGAPELRVLLYTNIFIEQKPFLYLHWKVDNATKVKISGFRKSYSPQCTVILKISPLTTSVEIAYSNFWRKRREIVSLKNIKIDEYVIPMLLNEKFHSSGRKVWVNTHGKPNWHSVNFSVKQSKVRTTDRAFSLQSPVLNIKPLSYE